MKKVYLDEDEMYPYYSITEANSNNSYISQPKLSMDEDMFVILKNIKKLHFFAQKYLSSIYEDKKDEVIEQKLKEMAHKYNLLEG